MAYSNPYLEKLMTAAKTGDPFKMAVMAYNAFRDSPIAMKVHKIDKEGYDKLALDSILRMAEMLPKMGWEEYQIEEFIIKSKELTGIE